MVPFSSGGAFSSSGAFSAKGLSEPSGLASRSIIFGGLANFLRLRLDAQQFFGIVIKLAFCRTHCFERTRSVCLLRACALTYGDWLGSSVGRAGD